MAAKSLRGIVSGKIPISFLHSRPAGAHGIATRPSRNVALPVPSAMLYGERDHILTWESHFSRILLVRVSEKKQNCISIAICHLWAVEGPRLQV